MLDELMGVVTRALPRLFGAPPTVPTREVNMAELEATARRCAECMALDDVRVLADRTLGEGVRYTDTWPPMILFGATAVGRMGAAEHAFHVARGIELGTRRLAGLLAWDWRAVQTLLETVTCLDGHRPPEGVTPRQEMDQRVDQLTALLDRRMQRALQDRLADLRRALPRLDIGGAMAAWDESANRVGLLLAGSIAPAVAVLRRGAVDVPGTPPAERLAVHAPVRALARWLVDDEYYEVRARLGLAPAH